MAVCKAHSVQAQAPAPGRYQHWRPEAHAHLDAQLLAVTPDLSLTKDAEAPSLAVTAACSKPALELPCPGPCGEDAANTVTSDLMFITEEGLTPLPPCTLGSTSWRAQAWWEPWGLQLTSDSKQADLAAGRLLGVM